MELENITWQMSPRFVVTGDPQALIQFVYDTTKQLGFTSSALGIEPNDKLLVHLKHISINTTKPSGRLQEFDVNYEYLSEHVIEHSQFVEDMFKDRIKTIPFKSTQGEYSVLVNKQAFMVEGLVYSQEFLEDMMSFYDKAPSAITNEPIVLLKDVRCFRIGCVDVSYNDGDLILKTMNSLNVRG
jgi:hypothetical protein